MRLGKTPQHGDQLSGALARSEYDFGVSGAGSAIEVETCKTEIVDRVGG